MCIRNATKKGIKNLPALGIYYKVLDKSFRSIFQKFRYRRGINIIPVCEQESEGRIGLRPICAGGHFYRNKEDAKNSCNPDDKIRRFRISRKDISYVGRTRKGDKGVTILATKATMLTRGALKDESRELQIEDDELDELSHPPPKPGH